MLITNHALIKPLVDFFQLFLLTCLSACTCVGVALSCTLEERLSSSCLPSLCSGHCVDCVERESSNTDDELLSDEDISDHVTRPTLTLSGAGFRWMVADQEAGNVSKDEECGESSSEEEEDMETVEVRGMVTLGRKCCSGIELATFHVCPMLYHGQAHHHTMFLPT